MRSLTALLLPLAFLTLACSSQADPDFDAPGGATTADCRAVADGWGPTGTVSIRAEKIVSGLTVPWAIGFLPDGAMLVTERPGRVRLVRAEVLAPTPVVTVETGGSGEGGLLGLAVDPAFAANRAFYIYYTSNKNGSDVNRVERYILSADATSARADRILLDDIPAGTLHDGGRLRFGPDGYLYVGTGDARRPELSQDPSSPSGKLLRIDTQGHAAPGNPVPGNPYFVLGVRNLQAFDWRAGSDGLLIADHGPSGELGLSGRDEVSFARGGDNLGWPRITLCDAGEGMISPMLSWHQASPPGGGSIYRGSRIPEWNGDLIIAMLGSRHLHRVILEGGAQPRVAGHEVYLQDSFGRLREVVNGPDGELYVTTSNCDGRGSCPEDQDSILRIIR